jgi:hypothetical protein
METNRAGANVLGSEKSVAVADAVFGTTAGWRPPLLITTIVAHDKTVFHCKCDTHTHGGLTPAALVNVRLCIGKIVIIPADGRSNSAKSGGRKPPVVSPALLHRRSWA